MKKWLRLLCLTAMCLCVFTLSGCFIFDCVGSCAGNSSSGNDKPKETVYEFSVQYEELNKYTFTGKDSIKIDPRYKEGYVLDGFYTAENGEGAKLLDWDGSCISSSFSGDGSTVLYPYYKDIDYDYVYQTPVWYEEDPKYTWYNVYGDPTISWCNTDGVKLQYLLSVATSNPKMKFTIIASMELQGCSARYSVGIGKNKDKSNLLETKDFAGSSKYQKVEVACEITGKALTIKDTKLQVGVFGTKFGDNVYYKNMQITVKIAESERPTPPAPDTGEDGGETGGETQE